eukprot:4181080-Ditylum_brightwellii.AAC.1
MKHQPKKQPTMGYSTSQPKQYSSVEGKANSVNNEVRDNRLPTIPQHIEEEEDVEQTEEEGDTNIRQREQKQENKSDKETYIYRGAEKTRYNQETCKSACSFTKLGVTHVAVHPSVEKMGKYAFVGCGELTSIIIPNGVHMVGEKAFEGCKKLSISELPTTIKQIK